MKKHKRPPMFIFKDKRLYKRLRKGKSIDCRRVSFVRERIAYYKIL